MRLFVVTVAALACLAAPASVVAAPPESFTFSVDCPDTSTTFSFAIFFKNKDTVKTADFSNGCRQYVFCFRLTLRPTSKESLHPDSQEK